MIDLSDLEIVIPFRCDSSRRLKNLAAILAFLTTRFANAAIVLIENAGNPEAAGLARTHGIRYLYEESRLAFHRTRLLNLGFSQSVRPYVASYDADVLWYPEALDAAMSRLRAGAAAAMASDGRFADISGATWTGLTTSLDPNTISRDWPRRMGPVSPGIACTNINSVGGAILFNRDALLAAGGYNENFVSWGWEDTELSERIAKLFAPYVRIDGYPLLHLAHPRGPDSNAGNLYFAHNAREYRKMRGMARPEIQEYVSSGGLRRNSLPDVKTVDRIASAVRRAIFSFSRSPQP